MTTGRETGPLWIIGDSHVSAFAVDGEMVAEYPHVATGPFPDVRVCRLGRQLAGTINARTSSTGGRRKAFDLMDRIPPGATIFFLLGEIDCRAHIVRRAGYDTSRIAASVEDTIGNYLAFLTEFRERSSGKGFHLGAIAPPPTSAALHAAHDHPALRLLTPMSRSNGGRRMLRIGRNFFPRHGKMRQAMGFTLNYAGTETQRFMASAAFARRLAAACASNGLQFIDMHAPFKTEHGGLRQEWYWDDVHLRQGAVDLVRPQFERIGLFNFSVPTAVDEPA